jgi:hypothetical protein
LRDLVTSVQLFDFHDERELELKGLAGKHRVFSVGWSGAAAAHDLATHSQRAIQAPETVG